jgi:hypothetical protein
VVPWQKNEMSPAATPLPSSVSMPCRIARDGSSGVDGTFEIDTSPVSSLR